MLTTAFGGYFGSRLMQNIRERKGYTYGIDASLPGLGCDRFLRVSTECDAAYVEAVIAEVRSEMERLRREPLPAEELNAVKQFLLGERAKMLDHPFSQASLVAMVVNGRFPSDHFNRMCGAVVGVTPERLLSLARQYFRPEQLRVVVATGTDGDPTA